MISASTHDSVQQALRVHVDPAWCLERLTSMQHRAMMARRSSQTGLPTSVAAIAVYPPLDRSPLRAAVSVRIEDHRSERPPANADTHQIELRLCMIAS
jgi:hypothetical protein